MGDPHYNTWGGKNNSWGNRNRKRKDDKNNKSYHDEPNNLFNTIAKGVAVFLAGAFVITVGKNILGGALGEVLDKAETIKDTVDTIGDIKDSVSSGNKTNTNNQSNGVSGSKTKFDIDIDIDEDDISDILEFITEKYQESNKETTKILDFKDTNSIEGYRKNVINSLGEYDNYCIVYRDTAADSEMQGIVADFNTNIVSALSNDVGNKGYKQVELNARTNVPDVGNILIMLTFTKK